MIIKNKYYFSEGILLKDLNVNNVINAFKNRLNKWYFDPIDELNQKKLGFAATALLTSVIDILAKTEKHDLTTNNNKNRYITWIEEKLNFSEEEAEKFYEYFRCGLLHAGCIEGGGYIDYKQDNLYEISKGSIFINPNKLCEKLYKIFRNFLDKENPEELYKYLKGKLEEIK